MADHDDHILESISKIQILDGIAQRGLDMIAQVAEERSLGVGEFVFREGDVGNALFLVVSGKVRVSRDVAGMGEEALAVLGEGEVFGEMSLVDEAPRSADVRVHEACNLLVIRKSALEELMFLQKDLAYELLWNFVRMLSKRLRETNDKMSFLSVTNKF